MKVAVDNSTKLDLMIVPCPKCKDSTVLAIENRNLKIKALKEDELHEPDGQVEENELKAPLENCINIRLP